MKTFFILFVIGLFLYSQQFSPGKENFYPEIYQIFKNLGKKEIEEKLETEFKPFWLGESIYENDRELVFAICNYIRETKIPPYPSYYHFLFGFMKAYLSGKIDDYRKIFKKMEELMKERKREALIHHISFGFYFFRDSTLYESPSVVWKIIAGAPKIEYTNRKVHLKFERATILGISKGDTSIIYEVNGVYDVEAFNILGTNGKIDWRRCGFNPQEIYAQLKNFNIDVRRDNFSADSVIYYNRKYFPSGIQGRLREEMLSERRNEKAIYPEFSSYAKIISIKDYAPGVDFIGGFIQRGAHILGYGDAEMPVNLLFRKDQKVLLKFQALSLSMRPEKISCEDASVTIYIDKEDSITHKSVRFSYDIIKELLLIERKREGIGLAPFISTYHSLEISAEALYWKREDPFIRIGKAPGSTNNLAVFSSVYYYRDDDYDNMMGVEDIHPLYRINAVFRKTNKNTVKIKEIMENIKLPYDQTKVFVINLGNMGFLDYNPLTEEVTKLPKLDLWQKAKVGKSDYDNIRIISEIDTAPNAFLNLLSNELKIQGCKGISLSDSQKVFIVPYEYTVLVGKNLDMRFNGIVGAGNIAVFGKRFFFDYKSFKITLEDIDSIRFVVPTASAQERGLRGILSLSAIESVSGEITIDYPYSKSGRFSSNEMPKIKTFKEGFVFYDKKCIFPDVYKRDNFYFKVYPFELNALDTLDVKKLNLKGLFVSANIFPDMEKEIYIMKDLSLGFEAETPPNGENIYQGKGKFFKKFSLSNNGFRGDGKIQYLNSSIYSNDFIFFPDSTIGLAQKVFMDAVYSPVQYPMVNGEDIQIKWEPYNDVMKMKTTTKGASMYDMIATFSGEFFLTPNGLSGSGKVDFENAVLSSKRIDFKMTEFFSDTANFSINSTTMKDLVALKTDNVKAHVDFKSKKGTFQTNNPVDFIDFPINQYIAYMDKFTWYMQSGDIAMSGSMKEKIKAGIKEVTFEGSKWISVHPQQDSLYFFSKAAKYDLNTNIITADSVELLMVADAIIYPNNQRIIVEPKAKMRQLDSALVVADVVNRYHNIYNATINVFGKKKYEGTGYYDYIDINKNKQQIKFDEITVNEKVQTVAKGKITEESNFLLNPYFGYKGEVFLKSVEKYLTFSGYARTTINCELTAPRWFKFSAVIDPEEVFIPISDTMLDDLNNKIHAGLVLSEDSIYLVFFEKKSRVHDPLFFVASGFITYSPQTKEYIIASMAKHTDINQPGNIFVINPQKCECRGEGSFLPSPKLGQVKLKLTGRFNYTPYEKSPFYFAGIATLSFYFSKGLIEDMVYDLRQKYSGKPVNMDRKELPRYLVTHTGDSKAENLIGEYALYGKFNKIPDDLQVTFFISDIILNWSRALKGFVSGREIGISNSYKEQLHKMIPGTLMWLLKRQSDELYFYINPSSDFWYYFEYQKFTMNAVSSESKFNTYLNKMKAKDRKLKVEKNEMPYSFILCSAQKVQLFQKKLNIYKTEQTEEESGSMKTSE